MRKAQRIYSRQEARVSSLLNERLIKQTATPRTRRESRLFGSTTWLWLRSRFPSFRGFCVLHIGELALASTSISPFPQICVIRIVNFHLALSSTVRGFVPSGCATRFRIGSQVSPFREFVLYTWVGFGFDFFFAGFVLLESGKGLSFILDFYSFLFLYLFSILIRDVASVASTIDFSQFSSIFCNSDSRNGFGFDPDFLFSVILHWKISLVNNNNNNNRECEA